MCHSHEDCHATLPCFCICCPLSQPFAQHAGELLPLQLIYKGKTERSLPSTGARAVCEVRGFHYTRSKTGWTVQATLMDWVTHIVLPDFRKCYEELGKDAKTQVHCSMTVMLVCLKRLLFSVSKSWLLSMTSLCRCCRVGAQALSCLFWLYDAAEVSALFDAE